MRFASAWPLGVCALSLGCRTPTEIAVELTSDIGCDRQHGSAVSVGHLGEALETRPAGASSDRCDAKTGRLGEIVLVPSGAEDDEVAIKVVLGVDVKSDQCRAPDYAGCIVARRALRYIPHTHLDLPIDLRGACLGIACNATETCVRGRCVDATIKNPSACVGRGCDESSLGGGSEVDGGADAGADAAADGSADAGVDGSLTDGGDAGDLTGLWPIAAGYQFTCALRPDKTVSCFGVGNFGEIGRGAPSPDIQPPSNVLSLGGNPLGGAIGLSTREYGVCARLQSGSVACWGHSDHGQLGAATDVSFATLVPAMDGARDVSPGTNQSCWVTSSLGVSCWGKSPGGRPDDGGAADSFQPVTAAIGGQDIDQIASGESFACARTHLGQVFCWGDNGGRQSDPANPSQTVTAKPKQVNLPGASPVVEIGAGDSFACARHADGTVQCWGDNELDQLGRGAGAGTYLGVGEVVHLPPGGADRLCVGAAFACAVHAGKPWCWGLSNYGQLGNGAAIVDPSTSPEPKAALVDGVDFMSCGDFHACARKGAELWCWGQGHNGQTAHPDLLDTSTPFKVDSF